MAKSFVLELKSVEPESGTEFKTYVRDPICATVCKVPKNVSLANGLRSAILVKDLAGYVHSVDLNEYNEVVLNNWSQGYGAQ